MSRLFHCLSEVCDGASLRRRLMLLADFFALETLRCRNRTGNKINFCASPFLSPLIKINLNPIQKGHKKPAFFIQIVLRLQFFAPEALAAAFLHPVPESKETAQCKVIELVFMAVEYKKKATPPCFSNACINST